MPSEVQANQQETEPLTDQAVFEGLYIRALKLQPGPLADELRAAGYDFKEPKPRYPTRIWRECLLIAARHVYPDMAAEPALFELGKRFIEGFLETILGKLIAATLPFLTLDTVVKRLPGISAMTSKDQSRIVGEKIGPGHWRVTWHNRYAVPEFSAGTLDAGLRIAKLGRAELMSKTPDGFVLEFRA